MKKSDTMVLKPGNGKRGAVDAAPRGGLVFIIFVALLIAGIYMTRIYMERKTMQMGIAWEQQHRRLYGAQKEHDNLLMERETYTNGDYILTRARQLGLVPPLPGQTRRLAAPRIEPMSTPPDAEAEEAEVAAAR